MEKIKRENPKLKKGEPMSKEMKQQEKYDITEKGESLRKLLLARMVLSELHARNVIADGLEFSKILANDGVFDKLNKMIDLLSREMPLWTKKLAEKSFDNRSGFVIWEEKYDPKQR